MEDIMTKLESMDVAKFRLMSTEALKLFLFMRKESVEGSFKTLVSRNIAFFTYFTLGGYGYFFANYFLY